MKKRLYAIGSLLALIGMCNNSCIGSADDVEQPQPPVDTIAIDTTQVVIDSTFVASQEYVQGEWRGQYVGFDTRMQKSSAIRRMVYFAPEGFYDSHVQGIVDVTDTIIEYKEFEHEHGTYLFDVDRQIMAFHVEYDSLLDFRNDILVLNPNKRDWTERIWFSLEREGRRDWIRTDENLTMTDNHTVRVVYKMSNQLRRVE